MQARYDLQRLVPLLHTTSELCGSRRSLLISGLVLARPRRRRPSCRRTDVRLRRRAVRYGARLREVSTERAFGPRRMGGLRKALDERVCAQVPTAHRRRTLLILK
jgi:hypothetical protein